MLGSGAAVEDRLPAIAAASYVVIAHPSSSWALNESVYLTVRYIVYR